MAVVVASDARPASALGVGERLGAIGSLTSDDIFEWSRRGWHAFRRWVREGYDREPAIMIGLGAIVVLPPLALFGLLLRRAPPHRRPAFEGGNDEDGWPQDAWIEVEGREGSRRPIGRGMLLIGRGEDNDLCLNDKSVDRYHAVIHRSPEAEFIITDLTGPGGNGVLVNGERVAQAHLRSGDDVAVGGIRIKFEAIPA
jgi:hypothetical protein